jgi:lipoprotein-anchoring transpeptidase ErfK/SrfK
LSIRSRLLVVVVLALVVLGGLAGGVYAYDHARRDRIAEGIQVGGIDVGGLTTQAARARLQQRIVDPLQQPIVVRRGHQRWRLTARRARIAADLDGAVDQALERSRSGGVVERTWRALTGAPIDASLDPHLTYAHTAVRRLVRRIESDLHRTPRDAKVTIDGSGVSETPSHDGRKLRALTLRRQITAAIVTPTATRAFRAHTVKVRPQVTTAELTRKYATVVIVNRGAFRLTLYKDLKIARTYPIAVGRVGLETPAGLYSIANKAVNPAWQVPNSAWAGDLAGKVIPPDDPSNPIKARWLGIYAGVGIHGTSDDSSIGTAASHGCIRMHIPDVEDLYNRVPIGSPVYIA